MDFIKTAIIFISLSFFACKSNSHQNDQSQNSVAGEPVEKNSPNSDYKPAFTGQTRIAGIHTMATYTVTIVTRELDKPWGIANLPDGRFLITEKGGDMRIVTPAGKISSEITGLPEVNDNAQGGLLGLTLDPDFQNNRMLYWAFSEPRPGGNCTSIAKGRLASDEKKIEGAVVIYRATPEYDGTLHYGSRILFDKTGNLIFSTGERCDLETRPQAQWLNSSLGKIIRITKDGKPAPGNPFENNPQVKHEIYSYGHRNIQGLAFHPVTGDLWENEFGPRGGDELNLIKPGKNYGWPLITYGMEYSGDRVGDGITQKDGLEQPVYYWDPVLSPSGMTFYDGKQIPEWKNNLFICGLSSSHIARLIIENNKIVGEERLLSEKGERFRDIVEGLDGALYAVTDGGKMFRIGK